MWWLKQNIPGILLSFALSLFASWLGTKYSVIGGPVFGILIGIVINNAFGKPKWSETGVKFTSGKILKLSIIVIGTGLSLTEIWKTGFESFYVLVITLCFAFVSAFVLGKLMNIPNKLTTLIGVGTAICGGSAIAAISPIIEAEETEVAYSISTIFLFNIIAVLIFPPLGHLLGLSDNAFGLWAGTAINDTSSVVAAGYAFSNIAGDYSTIVKLTRTTMIIPVAFIFAGIAAKTKKKEHNSEGKVKLDFISIIPWFIIGFLATSLMNTLGLMNAGSEKTLSSFGKFLIVMALTAIGLNADFKKMLKAGIKPLVLGLIVWFTVSIVSLGVQYITGQI